jgi:hypothetical protein
MSKERALSLLEKHLALRYVDGPDAYQAFVFTSNYMYIEHRHKGRVKSLKLFPRAMGYEVMSDIAPFDHWVLDT